MNADVMRRAAAAIREDYAPWPEHPEDGCCDAINYHNAVADWLDMCAERAAATSGVRLRFDHEEQFWYQPAMLVARLYLGEPVLCHNDHPFAPGVSTDHAHGESDPRWCDTCGEVRILLPSGGDQ